LRLISEVELKSVAVIVPAVKLPEASLATIVDAVLAFVALDVTVNEDDPDWFAVKDAEPERPVPETANVRVPSFAGLTAVVVTPVTSPFAFTVMVGIAPPEPKVPTLLLTVANVVALLTEVISPVRFGILVVDVAVPVSAPTNVVAVIIPLEFTLPTFRFVRVPTEVKEELTIPDPRVVEERTSVLLTL